MMSKIVAQMPKEPIKEVGLTSDDGWDWNGEDVSFNNRSKIIIDQRQPAPASLE
jgi:hypothetical protein